MTGTFEIVFSGLCLFLLSGDGSGYTGVDVNLLRTSDSWTQCKDGGPDGQKIKLHPHKPYLAIPNGLWSDCSAKFGDACSPQLMGCMESDDGDWLCNIDNRELCVEVQTAKNFCTSSLSPFCVAGGREAGAPRPDETNSPRAFDWIAHLQGISDWGAGRLRSGVYQRVSEENPLIVSRVRSQHGELMTFSLGHARSDNDYVIWPVRPHVPGSDHPKALSEHVSLRLENLAEGEVVTLQTCEAPNNYWWKFKPADGDVLIGVQNLAQNGCDYNQSTRDSGDDCTVATANYGARLRHYLWFYELVEWNGGVCPDYLPAPKCPSGDCTKVSTQNQIPGIRDTDNTLCPPSTFP